VTGVVDQSVSYGAQFADVYDDLFPVDGLPAGADRRIIELVDAGPSPRILEFGVGNGRFLVPLAAAGARCTGIDTSPAMLDRARASAARADVVVTLEQADCRTAHQHFSDMDGVICVGGTFGMFTEADQRAVLHSAANCLVEGGRLIIETHNGRAVDQIHRDGSATMLTFPRRRGRAIVATSSFDAASGLWSLRHEWTDDVTASTMTATEFSFPRTAEELIGLAHRCGFAAESIASGWEEEPFRENDLRMIVCLRQESECRHEPS